MLIFLKVEDFIFNHSIPSTFNEVFMIVTCVKSITDVFYNDTHKNHLLEGKHAKLSETHICTTICKTSWLKSQDNVLVTIISLTNETDI